MKNGFRLLKMRAKWNVETAKRIHVIVRTRPLNVREIRENAKVGKSHWSTESQETITKGQRPLKVHTFCRFV